MFGRKLKRQDSNAPIQARTINRPLDVIERLDKISVAAPLEIQRLGGTILIRDTTPRGRWIKITSAVSGTKYAWSEIKWSSGGTATVYTGLSSGTTSVNPAYEAQGSTTVPLNSIVWADPIADGGVVFRYGAC